MTEEPLDDAAAVLATKGIDPCDVTGVPAPKVEDSDVPSDRAVIEPSEDAVTRPHVAARVDLLPN